MFVPLALVATNIHISNFLGSFLDTIKKAQMIELWSLKIFISRYFI